MTDKEYLDKYKEYYDIIAFNEGKENEESLSLLTQLKEYNKSLVEEFPFLQPQVSEYTGKTPPKYDYTYTLLDDLDEGWRINFGIQMCIEIRDELNRFGWINDFKIIQLKEKLGAMRLYYDGISVGKLSDDYEVVKTDYPYEKYDRDKDYLMCIGRDDDENRTCIYHHYKILDKCKIDDIIRKYEDLSYITCIHCGQPATKYTLGWVVPICDECYAERERRKK